MAAVIPSRHSPAASVSPQAVASMVGFRACWEVKRLHPALWPGGCGFQGLSVLIPP